MNFKRIGRALICLIVICALLVNISPIRAKAIAAEAVLLPAIGVIVAILISLGINATYDTLSNSQYLNDMINYLRSLGYDITNGMIRLYALGEGLYGVQEQLVQDVFDGLYLSGAVYMEPAESYKSNTSIRVNAYNSFTQHVTSTQPFILYGVLYPYGSSSRLVTYLITAASATFTITGDMYSSSGSRKTTTKLTDSFYYYQLMTNSDIRDLSLIHIPYATAESGDVSVLLGGIEEISKSDIFELNNIASEGTDVAVGYPEWAAEAVPIVDEKTGTDEIVYPIVIVIPDEGVGDNTEPPETSEPTDPSTPIIPGDVVTPTLIERLFGNVTDQIENVSISIQEIPDLLREMADDLKKGFLELPGKFAEWFNDIKTKLQEFRSGQITILDILKDLFTPIRNAIVDALTYLFAPSETFIQTKVETLIAKYSTADTFFNLGNSLRAFFGGLGATPPIIYIDLGAAEGSYFLGGRRVFLDLTWYSRYKPTVDAIIGAFIWLWLAWRVFLSIPSIIHGEAGSWGERKTDIGTSNTSRATIVHQRELPPGKK